MKTSVIQFLFTFVVLLVLSSSSCKKDDKTETIKASPCDFSSLEIATSELYAFDKTFSEYFIQSTRWESYNADIRLVNEKGQLTASSDNTTQALEAWKLFKLQMPYNKSWEIAVEAHIPAYWNTNGGKEAQVGAGIFVGKPVESGQSSKVYECNFAAINGAERFVQAQLVANRLGEDPIDVQHKVIAKSIETVKLKIQFCASNKSLSLYAEDVIVGKAQAINSEGMDDWKLSESGLMDVGIMGFAENTVITSNQPTLDNFTYKIYK